MNNETFDKIMKARLEILLEILENRRRQYSADQDRLANFKSTGKLTGVTPLRSAFNLVSKQIICLRDSIITFDEWTRANIKSDTCPVSTALWSELFTDIHNYLFLMEALLYEEGYQTNPELSLTDLKSEMED